MASVSVIPEDLCYPLLDKPEIIRSQNPVAKRSKPSPSVARSGKGLKKNGAVQLRLVVSVCKKYARQAQKSEMLDLIQKALGLARGVQKFDLSAATPSHVRLGGKAGRQPLHLQLRSHHQTAWRWSAISSAHFYLHVLFFTADSPPEDARITATSVFAACADYSAFRRLHLTRHPLTAVKEHNPIDFQTETTMKTCWIGLL